MRKRYLDALIAAVVPALATLGAFTDGPSGKRMDAGETAFFARELESIKVQIVEAEYPTLLARQVIPMGSGVDPGADTYTWREFDRSGLAKVISNYATDIPDVEEQGKENKSSIESIGIGFSYSIQDIRAAAKVGRPLQARKAMLAREEAERTIDDILALGDSTRGVPGFLKTTGVPLLTVGVNGSWLTSATAAEMLADLRLMEFTVWKQSKKTAQAGHPAPRLGSVRQDREHARQRAPTGNHGPGRVPRVFDVDQDGGGLGEVRRRSGEQHEHAEPSHTRRATPTWRPSSLWNTRASRRRRRASCSPFRVTPVSEGRSSIGRSRSSTATSSADRPKRSSPAPHPEKGRGFGR
jgi:hypothetical protein